MTKRERPREREDREILNEKLAMFFLNRKTSHCSLLSESRVEVTHLGSSSPALPCQLWSSEYRDNDNNRVKNIL